MQRSEHSAPLSIARRMNIFNLHEDEITVEYYEHSRSDSWLHEPDGGQHQRNPHEIQWNP